MISPVYFFRSQYSLDYTSLYIGNLVVNHIQVADTDGNTVSCHTEFRVVMLNYKTRKVLLREVCKDRLVLTDFLTVSKAFCLPGLEKYFQMKE
jgi:hypothetical protein